MPFGQTELANWTCAVSKLDKKQLAIYLPNIGYAGDGRSVRQRFFSFAIGLNILCNLYRYSLQYNCSMQIGQIQFEIYLPYICFPGEGGFLGQRLGGR